jgi:hypothetical protein
MSVSIFANALDDMRAYFEQLPDVAEQAAVLALNDVATREGYSLITQTMSKQTNFPKGYLKSRLNVVRKATRGSLEVAIRGRDRATSLARFAEGQSPANTRGRGVRVKIKPGQQRLLRKAFLVSLRNGNTGLAVRLKEGETLEHSQAAVQLANNLYLLYGPSVDQVFRGVAEETAPVLTGQVSRQFLRQFARLSRG